MKLHRHEACVFAEGDRIYVLGGNTFPYEGREDEGRYCGEAYDIKTQSWELLALNVQDFAFLTGCTSALVQEEVLKVEEYSVKYYAWTMQFFNGELMVSCSGQSCTT
nr:uncharacterized protein LOC117281312 [Nicotiana tomentosiformis]